MALLTLAIGVLLITVLFFLHNALRPGLVGIPGPWFAKFSNLYRLMLNRRGRFSHDILDLHRKYGPYVRIGPDVVSICDSRMVASIYGRGTANFPKSDWVKSSQTLYKGQVVPALMTTQDMEIHASLKRPIASAYSVTNLMGYEASVGDTVSLFIRQLDERFIKTGMPCPLHHWLQYYSYDVIGVITFSSPMGFLEQGKDIDGMLGEIKVEADYRAMGAQMPTLDYWVRKNFIMTHIATPTHKIMVRARQILEARLAETEEKPDQSRRDFISRFLEAKEKHPDTLNNRNMMGFIGSNLQAGSDTTAIALRTVFYHVMKDKAILTRVRKELDDANVTYPVDFQQAYASLPYTDALIREALRIHPPFAMLLERFVPPDGLQLPDGRKLPGGTVVGMFGYTMHRDKEIFGDDADDFRPERWLQGRGEGDDDFKARLRDMKAMDMSFGHGSRVCVGRHIAELQIYKVVPTVLGLLDFDLVEPEKEWKVEEKFFAIQSGMDVTVRWRQGMSMTSLGRDVET